MKKEKKLETKEEIVKTSSTLNSNTDLGVTQNSKETVKKEYENLKEYSKNFTLKDLKSGLWFAKFLTYALKQYSKKVDASFFEEKYPHLPADVIINRRISLAKKYAAIEGALSTGAYTAVVAATITSGGTLSGVTIPAALSSFTADLLLLTEIQLQLAYDISILYNHKIDLEDPEDLFDLIRVSFGIKAGELLQESAAKLIPGFTRYGVTNIFKGTTLTWMKALPVVGKHLLQRNIIKFSIPVVSIPLATGLNYWITGKTSTIAKQVYRDKAAIAERANNIVESETDPYIMLKTVLMVIQADKKTKAEEAWLINDLTKGFLSDNETETFIQDFKNIVNINEEELLEEISNLNKQEATEIYEAACYAAAVDHNLNTAEHVCLKKIAEACRAKYNKKAIEKLAKEGLV